MIKSLKNALIGAGLVSATCGAVAQAQGNVSGNVEYIQPTNTKNNKDAYARINAFYGFPRDVSGFTFLEMKKGGYFGKTTLDRSIDSEGGLGARVIVEHLGEPVGDAGLGVTQRVPFMPEGAFANIGFMPVWFDKHGNKIENRALAQYFFTFNLPKEIVFSGFGDLNIASGNGVQWEYGEIRLAKKIGNAFIAYNPSLTNNGDASPKLTHRISAGVNFGGEEIR